MFSLIKFATHFGYQPFSTLDPMLMELIREEREMAMLADARRKEAAERRKRAEQQAKTESEDNDIEPDAREAA